MRRGSILLALGICLIVAGAAQLWYYTSTTYPTEQTQVEKNCMSSTPPAPCVSLSPASDQGPYVLGGIVAAIGVILSLIGALRVALATLHPPPRGRHAELKV